MQSCRWLGQSSVPAQQLGCFPCSSPHNPRRMEHDLLSCKHIGSSIENGLTKSIKADIIPGIGGWRGGGGGGGLWWLSAGFFPSLSSFLLALPSLNLCLFLSVVGVLGSISPSLLGFSSLNACFHIIIFPSSSASFCLFLFHALGSGQLQQWL